MLRHSALLLLMAFLAIYFLLVRGAPHGGNTLILVSIDGLSWEILKNRTFANISNILRISDSGVSAESMENVYPTLTWPNHQSLLTGLYPENHGIVSNRFWDPVFHEEFIYEYACSNYDSKFWQQAEPIWQTYQKQGGNSALYFWPGFSSYDMKPTYYEKEICIVNCSEINNLYNEYGWQCSPNFSEPFDKRVDKIIKWMKSPDPPKFVALYIDEPDWKLHNCGFCDMYKEAAELVDRKAIGHLLKRLETEGMIDRVNIILTSDHGLIETSSTRVIYLDNYIDLNSVWLTEINQNGHIWPKDVNKTDEIFHNLTNKHPAMKVYKKQDIPSELHWKNNARIPPLLVLLDGGWLLHETPPINSNVSWEGGNHGWSNHYRSLWSMFAAMGPDFKKGYKMKSEFKSIDLYPLMCHLLNIEARDHDGSIGRVAEMLAQPIVGTRQ